MYVFFSILCTVVALLLPFPPCRNSDPGSHTYSILLSTLLTRFRSSHFYHENISANNNLFPCRLALNRAALRTLSSWSLALKIYSKSDSRIITKNWTILGGKIGTDTECAACRRVERTGIMWRTPTHMEIYVQIWWPCHLSNLEVKLRPGFEL